MDASATLSLPELHVPDASAVEPLDRPRVVESTELLQGRRELWIEHRGELYRLRVTGTGKLYLTK